MNSLTTLLLSDTYKQTHMRMFPKGLDRLVSYWTPRKSMSEKYNKMVFFGLQEFMRKYLVEDFNNNFFNRPLGEVLKEYSSYMNTQLGEGNYDLAPIINLHELGYLPVYIRALPEGTLVDMGVPCIELSNTHPDFAWVVQWLECILQVELWPTCGYATIGKIYRDLANKYYEMTTDGADPKMAMSDFGMRGMSCLEDSIRASASWLLSFNKTSTIPALGYIREYYYADNNIGVGAVSTEHAVMGANFAVDGDEITFVKRLLTELYPDTSFSMVSDTYDYWRMVKEIIPQCKEEIMSHNGKLLIRPDSGDIVEISIETTKFLWEEFGGTVNSKGYKVLDPHIGIIYGDGCTVSRVEEIYKQLEELGFAANNIVFGVGAFCFHAIFEDDQHFNVLTRDMWGIAMKATHGELADGSKFPIYKDPKTDTSKLKKSHKGCCAVVKTDNEYECVDEYASLVPNEHTALEEVFIDGAILRYEGFEGIRCLLEREKF